MMNLNIFFNWYQRKTSTRHSLSSSTSSTIWTLHRSKCSWCQNQSIERGRPARPSIYQSIEWGGSAKCNQNFERGTGFADWRRNSRAGHRSNDLFSRKMRQTIQTSFYFHTHTLWRQSISHCHCHCHCSCQWTILTIIKIIMFQWIC